MLFGVMMYLEQKPLQSLLQDIRQRLLSQGTSLIAEPDPEGVVGSVEVAAKRVYAAIKSLWDPTKFTFYTKAEAQEMLWKAGFAGILERPELTPNAMGVFPPSLPLYYVIAANV